MYRFFLPLLLSGAFAGWPALFPGAAAAQQTGLSLQEVYDLARERNPMLQASEAAVQAVAAQERSARLPPDPQFQLGVMNASLPGLRTDMPGAMAPSVQVMQMVPFPGKLSLSGEIARQSTAMSDAVVAETAWEVRTRAAMAFFEIYQIDRQIEVMRETLELLRNFEQVAKAMYAAGEGRQSDLRTGSEDALALA